MLQRPATVNQLPCMLAGQPRQAPHRIEVTDKFTGAIAGIAMSAQASMVRTGFDAAEQARGPMRELSAAQRRKALEHVARRLSEQAETFALWLVIEVGKTIREARDEVARAIDVFRLSAAACSRPIGEVVPVDDADRFRGCLALWQRVPIGVCSFITPFNFPLNLAAHKVGPAIAAGCPFVLKPDPRTPMTSLMLGAILAETELPRGAFSIWPCTEPEALDVFSTHKAIALLSFTGSPRVGWMLKQRAWNKHVVLELGGAAACIVDNTTDLDFVAGRLVAGGFGVAGQSCISVQRVIAHHSIAADLASRLHDRATALRLGDPLDESTDMGPVISPAEADRIQTVISEATSGGASLICGERLASTAFAPMVLQDVPEASLLWTQELFGPALGLRAYEGSLQDAINLVNSNSYGIHTGIFTHRLGAVIEGFRDLDVAGVVVNDIPTTRSDALPYGGVKESGIGREGVAWAIDAMSLPRTLVIGAGPGGN